MANRVRLLVLTVALATCTACSFFSLVHGPDVVVPQIDVPTVPEAATPDATVDDVNVGDLDRLATQLRTAYRTGGNIDFDNDGTVDVEVAVAADGTTTETRHDQGHVVQISTFAPDGTMNATIDSNGDGVVDGTITVQLTAGQPTEVDTHDTDFDGIFDHRVTKQFTDHDLPTQTVRIAIEDSPTTDATAPVVWLPTRSYTLVGSEGQCMNPSDASMDEPTSCDPFPGVTNDLTELFVRSRPLDNVMGYGIQVVTTGESACNATQFGQLNDVMPDVLERVVSRIGRVNPTLRGEIFRALARKPLALTCVPSTVTCPAASVAYTWVSTQSNTTFGIIGVTASAFTPSNSRDVLTELLLHELAHNSGHSHEPDQGGDHGRDMIYGCARMGNSCRVYRDAFATADANLMDSARDQAACADEGHREMASATHVAHRIYSNRCQFEAAGMMIDGSCTSSTGARGVCCHCLRAEAAYCDHRTVPERYRTATEIVSIPCCDACAPGFMTDPSQCTTALAAGNIDDRSVAICPHLPECLY